MQMLAFVAAMTCAASLAPAQTCAPGWSDQFAPQPPPGVNDAVSALTVQNDELIVGGWFTQAGGSPTNYVARWDGNRWNPLAGGMNGEVRALVIHNGDVIAGGGFTQAGGIPANGIARWDGNQWNALGGGTNGIVAALTIYNNELIAGGWFWQAGGSSVGYGIARWDGNQWNPLASGMNDSVVALAIHNNELIAGGWFTQAGGLPANFIARWDGNQWNPLASGMNGEVHALVIHNDELIAGGGFTQAGGSSVGYGIARWDGVQWRPLGVGMNSKVVALATYNYELIAGGLFTQAGGVPANFIARWDGTQWNPLSGGMDSDVFALTVQNNDLIAGGHFGTTGGVPVNSIARWNGGRWHALWGKGASGGVGAAPARIVALDTPLHGLAVPGTSPFLGFQGLSVFTGGEWQFLPDHGGAMTDSAVFNDGAGSGSALYIAEDNVFKWIPGASGQAGDWALLGSESNSLVGTIEVFDDGLGPGGGPSLYAAGNFEGAGDELAYRVARWDGSAWHALVPNGGGIANGLARDMVIYDDGSGGGPALYVAGQFTFVDDNNYAYLARWDGSAWSRVGGGVNGQVTSLKVLDDGSGPALYIRGLFTRVDTQDLSAGGVAANRIARWNGSWSGLAGGVSTGAVLDLGVFDDGTGGGPRLYAAGSFTTIGGVSAKRAARWNNTTGAWEPLDAFGLNGAARTMAVFNDGTSPGIFFGGDFTTAGGQSALRIAKWDGHQWSAPGLGTDGPVTALAPFDSPGVHALYVGGNFTSAGGVPASYFTRYEGCPLAPAPCMGDANGDRAITFADITSVLENWGAQYPEATGPGDANHDGTVAFADVTKVLENWGAGCP